MIDAFNLDFFLIFHGQVQTCSHGSHTNCQTGELFILNMYVIGNQQSYQHDLLAVLLTTAGKGREVRRRSGDLERVRARVTLTQLGSPPTPSAGRRGPAITDQSGRPAEAFSVLRANRVHCMHVLRRARPPYVRDPPDPDLI